MPDITLTEEQVQGVLDAAGSRSPSVARALGLVTTVEPEPSDRPDPAETAANTYNVGEVAAPAEVVPEFESGLAGPDTTGPGVEDDGA